MTASDGLILVAGPPLAGVSGVVGALRPLLPECVVVEADELEAGRVPAGVVAVVSAVAPLTRSDWALIESASAHTGPVVAVVAKIDAHRQWRTVLDADRLLVAGWAPHRSTMPWVGVAAAPDVGAPHLGDLAGSLRGQLAEPPVVAPHRLRQNTSPELGYGRRRLADGAQPPSRPYPADVRGVLQHLRLRLLRLVRDRCGSMRAEFRDAASVVPFGGSRDFETLVRHAAEGFVADLDDEIARAVAAAAAELGVDDPRLQLASGAPEIVRAPAASRRLEARLMAVVGTGFGLGIALASSRLVAGVAPGLSWVALVVGAAVGLSLATWVVRVRGLLHDRAWLERWATEVAVALRWHGEAMVAERLLGAESAWAAARPRARERGPSSAPNRASQMLLTSTDAFPGANPPETSI